MNTDLEKRFEQQNRGLSGLYKATLDEASEAKELRHEQLSADKSRYADSSELGQGAMKLILCSHDSKTLREVARATLKKSDNQNKVESFLQEAELTAGLEHPNIVPVHDIGIDAAGDPYFTMKLIGGDNLASILTNLAESEAESIKRYGLAELLEIFQKICDAVSFAHSRGVLHLDLKPENIQIGDFGEVLVCDWGLARKILDVDQSDTWQATAKIGQSLDGAITGTPGYMSPEQAAGKNSLRSEASDIYALGGILYTMLTGACPIEGKKLQDILDKTIQGDFPWPRQRCPEKRIPVSLEAVVMKAMALEKRHRYESVDTLKQDVWAYQRGFATGAEEANFATQAKLFLKRNSVASSLIVVASLIITGLTVFFILRLQVEVQVAQEAQLKTQEALDDFHRISDDAAPVFYQRLEQKFNQAEHKGLGEDVALTIKLNPEDVDNWVLQGRYYLSQYKLKEAGESFRKAMNLMGDIKWDDKYSRTKEELVSLQRMLVAYRDQRGYFPDKTTHNDFIHFREELLELNPTVDFLKRASTKIKDGLMDPFDRDYHYISWKGKKYREFRRNAYFFDLWSEGLDKRDHQYYKFKIDVNKDNLSNWNLNPRSLVMRLEILIQLCDSLTGLAEHEFYSPLSFQLLNELRIWNEVEVLRNIFARQYAKQKPNPAQLFSLLKLFNPGITKQDFYYQEYQLIINSRKFFDLLPLTQLAFSKIDVSRSSVVDIRPLRGMALESLNVSGTKVYDLDGMSFPQLKILNISHLKLASFRSLGARQLEELELSGVELADWEELLGFESLKSLKLSDKYKNQLPKELLDQVELN